MVLKLRVKVHPNSSKNQVVVKADGQAEVWTKSKAEKNQANISTAKLLAKHFNKPTSSIRLVSGQTSRRKIFLID